MCVCVLMVNFRKRAVLISCIPAYIGAVLCAVCQLATSPELLMVGRFVTGINCGVYKGISGFILHFAEFCQKSSCIYEIVIVLQIKRLKLVK